MQFPIQKNNSIALVTVVLLTVILLYAVRSGYSTGKKIAQAEIVYGNGNEIMRALDFFYSDQNRFPSASEFIDQQIFGTYVSAMPRDIISDNCTASYSYKRVAGSNIQFALCLPHAVKNLSSGWHSSVITH